MRWGTLLVPLSKIRHWIYYEAYQSCFYPEVRRGVWGRKKLGGAQKHRYVSIPQLASLEVGRLSQCSDARRLKCRELFPLC